MFTFPPPERQIYVHGFLARTRSHALHDAVRTAAKTVSPSALNTEMARYAPEPARQFLQGSDIRDELVFAAPSVLRAAPACLGYYRLLLGVSQKLFYARPTGLGMFSSMEDRGVIGVKAAPFVADLCRELNVEIAALVTSLEPGLSATDIEQLPLMTLGAQADGSWRTQIGEKATRGVYEALKSVIKGQQMQYRDIGASLSLQNKAGRTVTLALAADPDVVVMETSNEHEFLKVAVEIKGGTDVSNVHNRAGEAEKSHQKAKGRGATSFWTIVGKTGVQLDVLRNESPTTNEWFDLEQVLQRAGDDWQRLVNHVLVVMGI